MSDAENSERAPARDRGTALETDQLRGLLEERFGHSDFLPGQREVIGALLEGRSAAAVFPTGGGKSLCYQLPALVLDGLTLVVSPLIALMKDQLDALRARGVRARRLDSTLSADEYREVTQALRAGELDLLYAAPERFNNERFREMLQNLDIALFAVDEAHCISEWGHNFRPDYLKLARFARECGAQRILALTATATDQVLDDVCRSFEIAPKDAVRTPFYRANLRLLASAASEDEREDLLVARLRERPAGATIVYVTLQRHAEQLRDRLVSESLDARAYHAGMEDDERTATQDWFFGSNAAIVVATIAFGMGIDKPDIRFVYHFHLPKSLEGYAQEIGRAGRDGGSSVCEMLVCPADLNVLESFVYGDTPTRSSVAQLVDNVFDLPVRFDVSIHALSASTDIRLLVVRTLLTYLELDGFLEGGTPLYSTYQFQPQRTSAEILAEYEGEPRRFLTEVFRRAKKGRTWFTLDLDRTAREVGADRGRVVRALDALHERGLLVVRASGVRHRYRRLREPASRKQLVDSLLERMLRRERAELARLDDVLEWATLDRCQVSALGERFGDPAIESCGHCSWCERGRAALELPPRPEAPIQERQWQEAMALRSEHPEALGEPRSITRFVCGVGSPRLTRERLTSHPLFGGLREVPFSTVLERARAES
ncbi:MAG TPA: ATP-dependent DNA helicase RecQ [Thermoanaerobaculia bacterium]|nr:ATP-dependent DNA helicase RecQ [Thermoanaerobaculia bacterium]